MKTLCTWLLQYFSTYNYIMKLCRYKKFAKVKIKFTLLKNVFFKLVETSRAGIHWRQIPACFFSRFSMAFIYTVSDTARTVINFIKSILQNVARNQSWKEFSFLLFFLQIWVIGFIYFVCCQNLSRNAKRPGLWLYFTSSSGQLFSKATLFFVYKMSQTESRQRLI